MSETTAPDYGAYQDNDAPSEDALARLAKLAQAQHEAELAVEQADADLKQAKEKLRQISETDIPTLMVDEMGVQEFTTAEGLAIKVDRKLFTSVPKAKKGQAMEWVNENGGAALVKRCFVIRFGKDDEAWAKKFARDLGQRKKPVDCQREDDVASATLKKFILDQIAEGVDVPLELFGGHWKRAAKVEVKG